MRPLIHPSLRISFFIWIALIFAFHPRSASAQCATFPSVHNRTITYRFSEDTNSSPGVLHITLEFQGNKSGKNGIEVPYRWAGETFHSISNLHALSADTTIQDSTEEETKLVLTPVRSNVVIAYDLRKDWSGPLRNPMQFHPVILPQYFEFTGSNALVKPEIRDSEIVTVNFDWQQLPTDWKVATSFGVSEDASTRCQSYTGPWREINQGLYAAGDFRLHHFKIGSQSAVLAVRGRWQFTDEHAIEQIQRTVSAVRNFWHDDNFPYFLVTLKPYDRDHGSSDGSAFTNAFWMYLSRLDTLDNLLPQLAHEAFHAWLPMKIGPIPANEYERTKWFKEGFTEYYAQLLMLRAGEITASQYLNSLNQDLQQFSTSKSEYVRGRIMALWLDGEIRKQSKGEYSLDDMMFAMVKEGKRPLTEERIFKTAGRYVSKGTVSMLQKAAEEQGLLSMPDMVPGLPDCIHTQLRTQPEFNLGFDYVTSKKTGIITGVKENGPAYAAGLRNGQKIEAISVFWNDTERPAKFRVETPQGKRSIEYLPQGRVVSTWRYIAGDASCLFN